MPAVDNKRIYAVTFFLVAVVGVGLGLVAGGGGDGEAGLLHKSDVLGEALGGHVLVVVGGAVEHGGEVAGLGGEEGGEEEDGEAAHGDWDSITRG